jgi:16S rRNA processing protein RimM
MEDLVKVGQTKKPHGVKGELKVFIDDAYYEDFILSKVVFLKLRGTFMPYFVEEIRGEQFLIVKLEDVNNREQALEIGGKEIALRQEDILEDDERTIEPEGLEFAHLKGFEIHDEEDGPVGFIEEVVEMPQQEMAVIIYKSREVLIPLNTSLIKKIDEKKKVVLMVLPEGLLNLF